MNKKNEKKVLEELRKRVLEKDRQLQERSERSNLVDSNKEALAEMTDLSRKEVDKIEKQIRAELQEKVKKDNKRRTWIITAVIIVGFIAFRVVMKEINKVPPPPPFHFIETFDNNNNSWDIYNSFELKRNIKNGAYSFVANKSDWCHWDDIELELPNSYSVKLTMKRKRGKFGEYGLMLMNNSNNYNTFVVRADGKATGAVYRNKEWITHNSWNPINFDAKELTTQKIEVKASNYKYYVNDELFKEGKIIGLDVKKIGLRICDKQSVDFLDLQVTNLKTGKLVFSDDFEKNSSNWDEKQDLTKESKIEHGKYIFTTSEENQCFWAVSEPKIKLPFADDMRSLNYIVKAKISWIEGEESNFGIMLMEDDNNYTAFQAMSSGDARVVRSEHDEYASIPDYISTNFISDGENSLYMKIKVEGNYYKFYINNKLITKGDFNLQNMTYLAMRVCGRQSVAFDEIEITETADD